MRRLPGNELGDVVERLGRVDGARLEHLAVERRHEAGGAVGGGEVGALVGAARHEQSGRGGDRGGGGRVEEGRGDDRLAHRAALRTGSARLGRLTGTVAVAVQAKEPHRHRRPPAACSRRHTRSLALDVAQLRSLRHLLSGEPLHWHAVARASCLAAKCSEKSKKSNEKAVESCRKPTRESWLKKSWQQHYIETARHESGAIDVGINRSPSLATTQRLALSSSQ